MTDTLASIRAAMHGDADTLRTIAQNIANADTTGYRRQVNVEHAAFDTLAGMPLDPAAAESTATSLATDTTPGTLRSTGEPTHVALSGAGFFVIETAGGDALTRRGDFRLDGNRILVTQAGNPVSGSSGVIRVPVGTLSINADGELRVAGELIDRLRIVDVPGQQALQSLDNGLLGLSDPTALSAARDPRVQQGFLESSNVAPVAEMMQLMEVMRHFEAAQRLAHGADDMLEKALGTLGKT
jgi:flagellar basal body rod protein FlgG